jgi:hypothetical protein
MAGSSPDFDPAAFRDGIRFAMRLGAPVNVEDRPTFRFRRTRSYPPGTPLDQNGQPLDPTATPITVTPTPVQVDCAVEFSDVRPDELPAASLRPTKVVITLLDTDYELVKNATEVLLGGDRYLLMYRRPPMAIFDAGVHQIIGYAISES